MIKKLFEKKLNVNISTLFEVLKKSNTKIHNNLKSRSTMNFGKVYNYLGTTYEEFDYSETPDFVKNIGNAAYEILNNELGVEMDINNCLINIYNDGNQKMGFHSDDVGQLCGDTGVLIVSIGATRHFIFRDKNTKQTTDTLLLDNGSVFYMDKECQAHFEHSLPKSDCNDMRISLTFRQLI